MARARIDDRFRELAEAAPDVVFSTDAQGRWEYANGRFYAYTGLSLGSAAGSGWEAAVHPDDLERARVRSARSIASGIAHETAYRLRDTGGSYRVFVARLTPVRGEAGDVVGWVGTAAPAASDARSAGSLQASDELLALLSHELRSPLSAVLNWCQILHTRKLEPAQVAQALATIERSARAQVRLIDDVLDVARIANGSVVLDVSAVELVVIVRAAVEALRPMAAAKTVNLAARLEHDPITVSGDAARLRHMVEKLLLYAIKRTPAGGTVEVRTEVAPATAFLIVRDGAESAPAATPSRAPGGAPARGSSGFGLSIVRYLAAAHRGRVSLGGTEAGPGSTYTVELPLADVEGRRGAPSPVADTHVAAQHGEVVTPVTASHDGGSLRGLRVVIVDDEPDVLAAMKQVLTDHGATVATAGSAIEAFDVLQQHRPDVLISDIAMPDADGYALLRKVRAPDTGERGMVPAIAVTGHSDALQRALAAGYQLHLTKPFDADELVAAVARLAGRR